MISCKNFVRVHGGTNASVIQCVIFDSKFSHLVKWSMKQECIPVGCVPSATVAVCWGEGGGRVCSWGGCLLLVGVCLLREVVSQHALRQTPPRGQTDRCKNITLATSLRTVKMLWMYSCYQSLIKMSRWPFIQVLSNNVAVAVLGELSPGGALMQGFSQQQLHRKCSK